MKKPENYSNLKNISWKHHQNIECFDFTEIFQNSVKVDFRIFHTVFSTFLTVVSIFSLLTYLNDEKVRNFSQKIRKMILFFAITQILSLFFEQCNITELCLRQLSRKKGKNAFFPSTRTNGFSSAERARQPKAASRA